MGEFPEKIKKEVREKANFRCCRCQEVSVEVHHIIPQKHGGSNDFDNAAPLCPNCHTDFGDNPRKRKEIREMRDWWYKKCEEMYKTVMVLTEKPRPKRLTKDFPIVFFYHKEKGYLHLHWPNEFLHYYLLASEAFTGLSKSDTKMYEKIAGSDFNVQSKIFVELVEWLIFNWLSLDYRHSWLLHRRKRKYPWVSETRTFPIETQGIESETVDILENEEFQKNTFSNISTAWPTKFTLPKSTMIDLLRGNYSMKSTIAMENEFYKIEFKIAPVSLYKMRVAQWLCGLTKQQQEKFLSATIELSFYGEPKEEKITDVKMSLYQKWAEDLCQEFQYHFDWLATLNRIKDQQIFEIREILDRWNPET